MSSLHCLQVLVKVSDTIVSMKLQIWGVKEEMNTLPLQHHYLTGYTHLTFKHGLPLERQYRRTMVDSSTDNFIINLILSLYKDNLRLHKIQILNQQHELINVHDKIHEVRFKQKIDLGVSMPVNIMQ